MEAPVDWMVVIQNWADLKNLDIDLDIDLDIELDIDWDIDLDIDLEILLHMHTPKNEADKRA